MSSPYAQKQFQRKNKKELRAFIIDPATQQRTQFLNIRPPVCRPPVEPRYCSDSCRSRRMTNKPLWNGLEG